MNAVHGFDANLEVAHLVVCQRHLRNAEVAFAVRGVLEELRRLLGDVPLRGQDVGGVCGLDAHEPVRRGIGVAGIELHAVDGSLRDDHEVTWPERERSKHRVERAGSMVDVEALIALTVLEVIVHRLTWNADADFAVGVSKEHGAAGDGVTLGRLVHAAKVPHPHDVGLDVIDLGRVLARPTGDLRGRVDVVHGGSGTVEALRSEDLFRVQHAIGAAELDVTFRGDLAECCVVGHPQPPDPDCRGRRAALLQVSSAGMRHIAVVTTSRADWGHVEPVLRQMPGRVRISLLVGGAHLDDRFGRTIDAIREAGYAVADEVPFLADDDSDRGMGEGIGRAVGIFSAALDRLRPDMVLLIADRFEMLAPAAAAMALRIPLAHIEGGEISEGAIDQQVRDALTKMSHLHLVPTQDAADRVIAMGEEPWRVRVTGAPSLDHLRLDDIPGRESVEAVVGLPLDPAPVVVAFHPTTMHRDTVGEAEVFFDAIEVCPLPLVFCFPNADAGYARIITLAEGICGRREDAVLRVNLDHLHYWGLIQHASCLAGNSSSGIMEAASLELPVVNVGIRQQGRTRAANIIDAAADGAAINDALAAATSPAFRASLAGMTNPYGDGHAAEAIVEALASAPTGERLLIKRCGDAMCGA